MQPVARQADGAAREKPARPVPKRTVMDDVTSRREAPTISQVAEAAGVSRATVSRACLLYTSDAADE